MYVAFSCFQFYSQGMTAATGRKIVKYNPLQGRHPFDIPGVTLLKNGINPVYLTGSIISKIVTVCALLKVNAEGSTLRIRFLRREHKSAHKKKQRHKNPGITF